MKFKCTAESIGYLETIIEAEDIDEAWDIFNNKLEMGDVPEKDGAIENEAIEPIEDEKKEN